MHNLEVRWQDLRALLSAKILFAFCFRAVALKCLFYVVLFDFLMIYWPTLYRNPVFRYWTTKLTNNNGNLFDPLARGKIYQLFFHCFIATCRANRLNKKWKSNCSHKSMETKTQPKPCYELWTKSYKHILGIEPRPTELPPRCAPSHTSPATL